MRRYLAGLGAALVVLGAAAPTTARPASQGRASAGDDVTVIAVVDDGITPYHWDYLASKAPASLDVPLNRPPHEWLRGFPSPREFAGYEPLELTLEEKNENETPAALHAKDQAEWGSVKQSTPEEVNYYWIPGTKIIGAVDFGTQKIYGPTNTHGNGASSVAVGNIHGSCPECVLVFVDTGNFNQAQTEAALEWAESQPWIDAVSNSYGHSTVFTDNVYTGSDTEAQRRATERGQTVFFAAHNGHDRSFFVPNNTLLSSQPGPDWIVTVGAVDPVSKGSFTGHGKPADISGVGLSYPSAYGSPTVGGEGNFSGTSNATPVVTGIYGRALYEARLALDGPSRTQSKGVIARGRPVRCGKARPRCELGDGVLTAAELRRRLFHGAVHTDAGMTSGAGIVAAPAVGEDEFLNEGHGTYLGLLEGPETWLEEIARVVDPMLGEAKTLERPAGEAEWMTVDSFCRQHLWGAWKGGYYVDGKTELPGTSPEWPVRSLIETACPNVPPF
ncbi:MAG TPA: S8/S53 family peptidase [Actinomycetota bacterium]|nr:S8/S53 family peptidase [Actinomycetota bacterium]